MNKYEKELAALELKGEAAVLKEMQGHYEKALARVNEKIAALAERDDLSGIRQRNFQVSLAEQIGGSLDELRSGAYTTLEGYLAESYADGFIGSLYNLQKQDIPLAFPLDQEAMARAVSVTAGDVKLSKRVYDDVGKLQKQVISEITRGFADASHVTQIAESMAFDTDIAAEIKRNVGGRADQALRRSMTIARTEKGRVLSDSRLDAMRKAKAAGADIVKQWDSTLDGRTRSEHVNADGQIRELEEPFVVGGRKGMAPHKFGIAAQDVNCRCACLQRARAALEWDDKYTKWDGAGQCYVDLSDAENYETFKTEYLIKNAEHDIGLLGKRIAGYNKQAAVLEAKSYSGIWRDPVTVKDYAAKSGSIAAKRDYFDAHLADDADKFGALKALLSEFEADGKKYSKVAAKKTAARADLASKKRDLAKLRGEEIVDDAFSDERKNAALWFTRGNGGFKAADDYFDPPALKTHAGATKQEHDGFYAYTSGSGGHNRPLAGFRKPWGGPGSGWEKEYYVGPKKVWIDYEGKGGDIRGLTSLIEKSTYGDDVWLQSGQNFATIEGFLGIDYGSLSSMGEEAMEKFIGRSGRIYNFLSCAVNKGGGSGFNSRPAKINFYAPNGSQMLYASDKGPFGKSENEMILQRGGYYKVTRMYWGTDATDGNKRKLFVDMEIHVEEGYDLFQQDPREWRGSKDNYKSN